MATLTLKNKKPAAKTRNAEGEKRAPVRGKGVSKPRPTLAQAQADRAEREERYQQAQQKRERPAPQRDERPARPKATGFRPEHPPQRGEPFRRDDRGDRPRDDRQGRPGPRAGGFNPDGPPQRAQRGEPVRRNEHRDERPADRPRDDRPPRIDQRRASNRGPDFEPPQRPQRRNNPARQVDAEDGDRLSKRMSELKLASRREADEWIAAGWVRVDGKVAVLGQRVVGDVQIDIDPAARQAQSQLVTVLLHKPIGYVSGQAEDGYEPAVVLFQQENRWKDDPSGIKPHPNHHRHLAPAGRLDIDSTGLLVLTQDGRIAKALIGDDSDIEKEYLVRVEFVGLPGGEPVPEGTLPNAALSNNKLALLNHGLSLDGEELKPAKVSWQNEHQLRFVLREGKKRQIRRMCELVGLKVVGLKRVRIGRIPLGNLPVGQWRYLAPWERF
ncbi:pseudouridine synthase [Roseateles asaccharophilus]|uniref:Dual-specificity RNA pseudouridine synthase RluF n=1 Tax=Roseateles asaccharophilus TaxID=582607 RepID=A0ABU2A4W0_9BURK|nr:pseudouridine synthase [Roseateles asaccharophilus]MDR7332243.1 23S rRNA pseudouridine2604 synthase [Roseateles asaccharophilus]